MSSKWRAYHGWSGWNRNKIRDRKPDIRAAQIAVESLDQPEPAVVAEANTPPALIKRAELRLEKAEKRKRWFLDKPWKKALKGKT